jgi:ElaB/YqjD/DUF883 family membrane-anchored ribosome-binding protein
MNSIIYPKYIYSIGIILIILIVLYYMYQNLNKTIEGATTENSQTPDDTTNTLKQQISDFTKEIYDTVNYYLTSKTKESGDKTSEILKKMDEELKNIEKPPQLDPALKKKLDKLKTALAIKINKLKFMQDDGIGTSIEILQPN